LTRSEFVFADSALGEKWRKELAQNLALRNWRLSDRELNFAVERIIELSLNYGCMCVGLRPCPRRGPPGFGFLRVFASALCNKYLQLFPSLQLLGTPSQIELFGAPANMRTSQGYRTRRKKAAGERPVAGHSMMLPVP
jgi:hypothetical protein